MAGTANAIIGILEKIEAWQRSTIKRLAVIEKRGVMGDLPRHAVVRTCCVCWAVRRSIDGMAWLLHQLDDLAGKHVGG